MMFLPLEVPGGVELRWRRLPGIFLSAKALWCCAVSAGPLQRTDTMAKASTIKIPPPPPPAGGAVPTPPAPPPSGTEPPAPPPPPPNSGEGTQTPPAPPPVPGDNENGAVTTGATTRAADALDRDANGSRGGSLPKDSNKRGDAISLLGFEDGKAGTKLDKPKDWTDGEYGRYTDSYLRGEQQAVVNNMDDDERLRRIESTLGLVSPERE